MVYGQFKVIIDFYGIFHMIIQFNFFQENLFVHQQDHKIIFKTLLQISDQIHFDNLTLNSNNLSIFDDIHAYF